MKEHNKQMEQEANGAGDKDSSCPWNYKQCWIKYCPRRYTHATDFNSRPPSLRNIKGLSIFWSTVRWQKPLYRELQDQDYSTPWLFFQLGDLGYVTSPFWHSFPISKWQMKPLTFLCPALSTFYFCMLQVHLVLVDWERLKSSNSSHSVKKEKNHGC